jgi:hypothetical protein
VRVIGLWTDLVVVGVLFLFDWGKYERKAVDKCEEGKEVAQTYNGTEGQEYDQLSISLNAAK